MAVLAGFGPQTRSGVVPEIGRTLDVEFTLDVRGASEHLVVEVTPLMLQTTTAEISDVIENRGVLQLPLNGRHFRPWLSHSKDDASSPGATESEANVPQSVNNIFDETGEWAVSSFDHRHQFIASGVYHLPFFRGLAD